MILLSHIIKRLKIKFISYNILYHVLYSYFNLCAKTVLDNFQDSLEPEVLGSGSSINYVWDDLTLPHKLIVQIGGNNCSLEIMALENTF